MAEYVDNPAGRLLNVIEKLQDKTEVVAWSVWPDLFETGDDSSRTFRNLAQLAKLPRQIRNGIEAAPGLDLDVYLARIGDVDSAFANLYLLGNPISSFLNPIVGETTRLWLEFCSSQLHRTAPEQVLDVGARDELLGSLGELINDVSQVADSDLQEFLIRHVLDMIDAVRTSAVHGASVVVESVETTLGAYVLRPELRERLDKEPAWRKWAKLVGKVLAMLSISLQGYQLAQTILPELPAVPSQTVVVDKTVNVEETNITIVEPQSPEPNEDHIAAA